MTSIAAPVCVAPTGDWCGEGAVWHAAENSLYWTDINRFLIHRYDAKDRSVKTWFFAEPVTSLILTDRDDTLAVVLGSKVILWKPATDERADQGYKLNGWPRVRFNDARADPRGSLWLGSMRNNVNPDGSPGEDGGKDGGKDGVLIRVDPDGAASEWKREIGISNTVAWSPDHRRFYTADSPANEVYVFDYDPATGAIGGERPFFTGFERGSPDGSTVDSEGYLWNCRYGGHAIVRLAPDGEIERVIEMPVSNVTNCTFGGPDLTTLYITTAGIGAMPHERFGGGLFTIETNIQGLPENRFRVFGI
jgi:sugar lactone lactonase YvrE